MPIAKHQATHRALLLKIFVALALVIAAIAFITYPPSRSHYHPSIPIFAHEDPWLQNYADQKRMQLTDKDPSVRLAAADSLGDPVNSIIADDIREDLKKAVDDSDPAVRYAAACSLARMGYMDDPVAVVMAECFAHGAQQGMRHGPNSIDVAQIMGQPAIAHKAHAAAPIIAKLTAPDQLAHALNILGKIGDPVAVPALRQALSTGNDECRCTAARALALISPPALEAVPELTAALFGKDFCAQLSAETLAKIGAIDGLLEIVQKRDPERLEPALLGLAFATNRQEEVARILAPEVARGDSQAADSLLALGDLAKPALPEFLAFAENTPNHAGPNAAAEFAVKFHVEDQFLPIFLKLLASPDDNQHAGAVIAIGNLGPAAASATPALLKALKSTSERNASYYAAAALGMIKSNDPQVIPALIAALDSSDALVQENAAHSLAAYGMAAKDAVPRLIKMRWDPGNKCANGSMGAWWALKHMGPAAKDAVPALIEDLKAHRAERDVFAALLSIGPDAAGAFPELFAEALEYRSDAQETLVAFGQTAIPFLLEKLQGSPQQQSMASRCLSEMDSLNESLVPILIALLENQDRGIRAYAARGLAKIGAKATNAVVPLRKLLADPEPWVQFEAATALRTIARDRQMN